MDNTVGSQRNLTSKQKEVLIGTLLGDGMLELNGRYVRLRVDHTIKQKAYVKWKYRVFRNLTTSSGIRYLSVFDHRRKRVPKNIIRILKKPLSLAVWFMDDGYKRNDCNALRINTDSFSFKDQELLVRCLKQNFRIDSKLHRKGKFWNIYIPSLNSEARKFCRIVKPYIIPEMEYKISLTP